MVSTVERHQARVGDEQRQHPPLLEGDHCIVTRMQCERRRTHAPGFVGHVYPEEHRLEASGVFYGRGTRLQLVEPLDSLGWGVRREEAREHLTVRRSPLPPPEVREAYEELGLFDLLRRGIALQPPARVATVQHEHAHALGLPRREDDRHGCAPRDAERREAVQLARINYRFEIADRDASNVKSEASRSERPHPRSS
jgi:hypothetical protein